MKTTSCLLTIFSVFLLASCKKSTNKAEEGITLGSLYISKAMPKPGDTISIKYHTVNDSTVHNKKIEAFYQYMVNNIAYPVDIDLNDSLGAWQGKIAIPDSATAIVYNFKIGDKFDGNHKKGYAQLLYNEEGEAIPGSNASIGCYYIQYREMYGVEVAKDSAMALIQEDLKKNPTLLEKWDIFYPRQLYVQNKEEGKKLIEERIQSYKVKEYLSENDYRNLVVLNNIIGNESQIDSLKKLIVDKHPKGVAAREAHWIKFYEEKNIDKRKKILEEFVNTFGDAKEKDMMLSMIAREQTANGNLEGFTKYADQISDEQQKASIYNNLAWKFAEEGENLSFAAGISKKSLDFMQSLKHDTKKKPSFYSVNQYRKNLDANYEMYADTYALILFKQGRVEEALKYQKEAVGEGKVDNVNERYIQFLLANEKFDEAQTEAERFIENDAFTSKIKEYIKEAFVINTGSNDGFEEYLANLEKIAHAKAVTEIKNTMLNKEAPNFTLKDLDGKEVTLSSLKGKVVILDFWATWCGPCKASFPGMQMAVDKYKDNSNVKFLFIDTMEGGKPEARKKTVADFINKNKYSFHVLLDNPIEEGSREFEAAKKYQVNGIPTKIIIGPEGNIKFEAVGYNGQAEKLVKELDIMIELIQP